MPDTHRPTDFADALVGRLLPIRRLLSQIPEIGTQIDTVNLGHTRGGRIQQALAQDGQNWWSLLAFWTQYPLTRASAKSVGRCVGGISAGQQQCDRVFGVSGVMT